MTKLGDKLKKKKKILVQAKLPDDLVEKLDRLAGRYDVSRARLIEIAVEEILSKE